MVNLENLLARDAAHIWPPCTPLRAEITIPRLVVDHAEGSYLYTQQGRVIDAISSWWCKSLGHRPKPIIEAIQWQLNHFEHVISANATYQAQIDLAEVLSKLTRKQHLFFASDGSSAVEIALKLARHAMQLRGKPNCRAVVALENGYHGETLGALSVSDAGQYRHPAYEGMGIDCRLIRDIPYVSGEDDPLWHDCSAVWPAIEAELDTIKTDVFAVILEPLIQGAGGMRLYSADFLKRLADWSKRHEIYLIVDEIMTGLGRTGRFLAIEYADINPDLICLSKGLTAGTVPLSCVLIDKEIYALFEANPRDPFLHSHTYTGHALGVAAALATVNTCLRLAIHEQAARLGRYMHAKFETIAHKTGAIEQVRFLGAMVSGDLKMVSGRCMGRALSRAALERGALLRPIGNTLYWMPPLNTPFEVIDELAWMTEQAIHALY